MDSSDDKRLHRIFSFVGECVVAFLWLLVIVLSVFIIVMDSA